MKFLNCLLKTSSSRFKSDVTKTGKWPSYMLLKIVNIQLDIRSFLRFIIYILPICFAIGFRPFFQRFRIVLRKVWIRLKRLNNLKKRIYFTFSIISSKWPLMNLYLGVLIPLFLKNRYEYHIFLNYISTFIFFIWNRLTY